MTDSFPIPGTIEIAPTAVAGLVSQTVLTCYGVVAMASQNPVNGLVEILQNAHSRRGVQVSVAADEIVVDLYIVVEYGMRISAVAENVMNTVKFVVERTVGIPVREVNVHVQGLRISHFSS
jgi:uncharacterized alkaline shock family protein YloU